MKNRIFRILPALCAMLLTAAFAADGALLLAARYDGGRMTAFETAAQFSASGTITPGGSGTSFKLMLVDGGTFAPLCPAALWPQRN